MKQRGSPGGSPGYEGTEGNDQKQMSQATEQGEILAELGPAQGAHAFTATRESAPRSQIPFLM